MSYTTISRDPFARGSQVREVVASVDRLTCAWCGNDPGRFRYGWSDDQRAGVVWERKAFCSKSCRDSYVS